MKEAEEAENEPEQPFIVKSGKLKKFMEDPDRDCRKFNVRYNV